MPAQASRGLLVLPGWDDNGQQQFAGLKAALEPRGWLCRRADLPDNSWPAARRAITSRADALRQALIDYDALASCLAGGAIVVLGFSFGAYIGVFVTASRSVGGLILRSPALYPDDHWRSPKEELDKGDIRSYRRRVHRPADNGVLACCAQYDGDVLLVDSADDRIIPKAVIASYEGALKQAHSVTRYTLAGADHQLTKPAWQDEYRDVVLDWLGDDVAAH